MTAWLIAAHAVNVPVWDGWERGVLLEKASSGELDMAYLFSAHIDHRPFVPRVITLASNALTGGDVRAEMWIGYLAVVAGAIGLCLVLRKSLSSGPWLWGATFAVNLIIFSPLQYQNFLWAVQLAFLLPLGCLGLLLAVMTSGWKMPIKFAAAAALSLVATFSFGHGLILWPVAVCMALMHPASGGKQERIMLGAALIAVTAATLIAYFNWSYINTSQPWHAYGAEPNEPPPAVSRIDNVRENAERVSAYFWSSLGNPVARLAGSDPLTVSIPSGKLLLVLLVIALLAMFVGARRPGAWAALLPWAACAAFAVVAAAMMASGRGADLPLERSILTRYASLTGYLPIGLVGMAACGLYFVRDRWGKGMAMGLLGLLVGLQSQAFIYGAHKMSAWETARLAERFQLLYLKHKPPRFPVLIDGGMAGARDGVETFSMRQAKFLNEKGWLRPAMFDEFGFGAFEKLTQRALAKSSDLTLAYLRGDGLLHLAGFATLPDGRIADGVLVAWRVTGGDEPVPRIVKNRAKERAFAERVAGADWKLLDVLGVQAAPAMRASFEDGQFGANRMNVSKRENYAKFDDPVSMEELPEGEEVEITLWVVDCKRMEIAPIKRSFRMTKGVTPVGETIVRAD